MNKSNVVPIEREEEEYVGFMSYHDLKKYIKRAALGKEFGGKYPVYIVRDDDGGIYDIRIWLHE